MLSKIKKWIMALINKNQETQNTNTDNTNLTLEELEYIFGLIRRSNFQGTELDTIYRIIIKLQNRYNLLKK